MSTQDLLATELAGIRLRNPVILAAGTAGVLDELADVLDLARIGGLVTKSITPLPRDGNDTWRVIPDRAGMLNAIGLANPGVERFGTEIARRAPDVPTAVIGSIAGFSIDDYVEVAAVMDDTPGISLVELNVSCPNVQDGVEFGSDPDLLASLVRAVRPVLSQTGLIVKLPPIAIGTPTDLTSLARAAIEPGGEPAGPGSRPGADALCLCNTMPAMAIDVQTRRPRLANVTGGLSGPAMHKVVVRLVHQTHRAVARSTNTPIIGTGGVVRWQDAAQLILAGASAVGIGSALFADPRAPVSIARGLAKWTRSQRAGSIRDLIGAVDLS